ncbi:class I adenylate-forming enzyme family protein [Lysobacter sp. A03]|uniref:class I adenylate-forming enzyme family protein n=1 Tax=Lysobacter sp. A03 TaxID=1199154 RepID=UPI0005B74659|nr:class I adenylate-forming enzyme family protein [Lysobacter sp. A03]KIQ98280.1 Long-chain-fatty-acid--CoA ligase [Lysobacter sp. A03]
MTKSLASRLLATARHHPHLVAVVDGDRRIDYTGLAARVKGFAGFLHAQGFAAGERIAVVLPNSIEAVVACYGSWLAGCVAVPLNAQARGRELGAWLRHSGATLLVHETDNTEIALALAEAGVTLQHLVVGAGEKCADGISWQDAVGSAPVASAAHVFQPVATILYTSGTTGSPKGVTLTHANVVANTDAIVEYLELTRADSALSVLPFYYSYGASVLHTHLAVGARLVLQPNLVFPDVVVEAMARERVTGFPGVASMFSLLLDRVSLADHDLSALRYMTQAGGAMAPALIRRLRNAIPHARLFVMYGQTEATARLAWLPPERLDDKPGSAGKAIRGVSIEVRDDAGDSVPAGTPGEVWVRGPNVMAGYWKDPAATALVLRDGWLRTGDMGHLDGEGYLTLDGRRSDMIKTGAHRVHPLDVEEVLFELPGVVDAAVVGVDEPTLGQVVKVFIVAAGDPPLDADLVRAHCRRRLAAYKVPRHVEFVATLPRTASGKVRRALLTKSAPVQELQ